MGKSEKRKDGRNVAIIVAHPDDETLWAGGAVLMHPEWQCSIYTLCRRSDPDRSQKFFNVIRYLKADGDMADLDDGPDQRPLAEDDIHQTILDLINGRPFDLIITHSPWGEYTRHRRHEEIGKALPSLWRGGEIQTTEMWFFAYEDGRGAYPPQAERNAHHRLPLPKPVRNRKYHIITALYGFSPDSWETRALPEIEAFWCFDSPKSIDKWYLKKEEANEDIGPL